MVPLVDKLVAADKTIAEGYCYGYVQSPVLGGYYNVLGGYYNLDNTS